MFKRVAEQFTGMFRRKASAAVIPVQEFASSAVPYAGFTILVRLQF